MDSEKELLQAVRNSGEKRPENRGVALVLVVTIDIDVLIGVGMLMVIPCYQDRVSGCILSGVTTIAESGPRVQSREGVVRTRKLDRFIGG